jgi:ribosome modulation factor
MTHHKVSDEARRGMAPAMFAFVGALAAVIFSVLYLLFGAWPTVNHLTAFDVGVQAFERGISRSKNPYMAGDDRVDWFRGWDRAKSMTAQKAGAK